MTLRFTAGRPAQMEDQDVVAQSAKTPAQGSPHTRPVYTCPSDCIPAQQILYKTIYGIMNDMQGICRITMNFIHFFMSQLR